MLSKLNPPGLDAAHCTLGRTAECKHELGKDQLLGQDPAVTGSCSRKDVRAGGHLLRSSPQP